MNLEENKSYLLQFSKDINGIVALSNNAERDSLLSKISESFNGKDEYEVLFADKEFMLECIKICPTMFQCASESLRTKDRDFVSKSIAFMDKKDASNTLTHTGSEILAIKDFVLDCVKQGVFNDNFNSWYSDEDVMLAVAEFKLPRLTDLASNLRESVSFFEKAISIHPRALKYASGKVLSDFGLLIKAIEAHGDNIECIRWPSMDHALSPVKFEKLKELALTALHSKEGDPQYIVNQIPPNLRDDKIIQEAAIKRSGLCFLELDMKSDFCRDVDVVRQIYEQSPFEFDTVAQEYEVRKDSILHPLFQTVLKEKESKFDVDFHVKALTKFVLDSALYDSGPAYFKRPFTFILDHLDYKTLSELNSFLTKTVTVNCTDDDKLAESKVFMLKTMDEVLHKKSIYAIQGVNVSKKPKRKMP